MKKITFEEYCLSLGINAEVGELALSLPVLHKSVLHFRAFCLADIIMRNVVIEDISWAEVCSITADSDERICALIQFDSCTSTFPMEIPVEALSGNKGVIEREVNRVLTELPGKVGIWLKITMHGAKMISEREFFRKLTYCHR